MSGRVRFVLKLLVGAYLVFVGVTLLRTILEVRPSNQEIMCGIATVFILVGAGYLIGVLGSAIKRSMEARAAEYREEPGMVSEARPARDQSLFRTAPMKVLDGDMQLLRAGEDPLLEGKQGAPASRLNASTVTLQKVGPDTMVWENKNKER